MEINTAHHLVTFPFDMLQQQQQQYWRPDPESSAVPQAIRAAASADATLNRGNYFVKGDDCDYNLPPTRLNKQLQISK